MKTLRFLPAVLAMAVVVAVGQTSNESDAAGTGHVSRVIDVGQPPIRESNTGTDAVAIPRMLAYQGKLLNAAGQPAPDSSYSMLLCLYESASGGMSFWSETQTVATEGGLFSLILGAARPIPTLPGSGNLYLGIKVGTDPEMTPRTRIASVAYAYKADTAAYALAGAGGDNAWSRTGDDSVLYTRHRVGIARGGASNRLYGNYTYTMTNLGGGSCTTGVRDGYVGNIAVGGGFGNRAWAPYSTVCGGRDNKAGDGVTDTSAVVAGGYGNVTQGKFAAVAGGLNNTAGGSYATAVGGEQNLAVGPHATVAGGDHNTAGSEAFIGGGAHNVAGDAGTSWDAVVCGGHHNVAGSQSFVGGGSYNTASGGHAAVGGGHENVANAASSTVSGGATNEASGVYSAVGGGLSNAARGYASQAAGAFARANHGGGYVWSDSATSPDDTVFTTGSNQWRVRARGGTWFFSDGAMTSGVVLAPGSNSWSSVCDSANKEDFRPLDKQALLARLAAMKVRDYKMKSQTDGTRHIGPVAQDFLDAFGYGESPKSINNMDAIGVALAAIQALDEQNKAQQAEIDALKAELARLRK